MQRFKDYLRKNGLRCTKERLDIVKAVCSFNDVFSAEELLEKINKNGWPVSKATLYRCIHLHVESGIIKSISPHQFNKHFFKKSDNDNCEEHSECISCGKALSVKKDIMGDLKKLVERYDFKEIFDCLMQLKGVCPDCSRKIKIKYQE